MEIKELLDNLYVLRAGLSVISQNYDEIEEISRESDDFYKKSANKVIKNIYSLQHSRLPNIYRVTSVIRFMTNLWYNEKKKAFETGYTTIYPEFPVSPSFWYYGDISRDFFKRNRYDTNIYEVGNYKILDEYCAKYKLTELCQKNILPNSTSIEYHFSDQNKIETLAYIVYGKWLHSNEALENFKAMKKKLAIVIQDEKNLWDEYNNLAFFHIIRKKKIKSLIEEKHPKYKNNHIECYQFVSSTINNISDKERLTELNQINNEILKKQTIIQKNSIALLNALQEKFYDTLDIRDWQHLDLVIYYLETRRAESIKEALQLVDRELQTERIVQTVNDATNQICQTITTGFAIIQNTITHCFDTLSKQIAESNAILSQQISQLTNSVDFGNALQAKANVTSQQLMEDVHRIKVYQIGY